MKQVKRKVNQKAVDAVEETLRLYHAWLAVLLMRCGEQEIRVSAAQLKEALGKLKCRVTREEGDYVIFLDQTACPPHAPCEVSHGEQI